MSLELRTGLLWQLIAGLLAVTCCLVFAWVWARYGLRRGLLAVGCIFPLFHIALQFGTEHSSEVLNWTRLWATPLPTGFGLFVAVHAFRQLQGKVLSQRQAWHETAWIASIWLLGCAVAGPIISWPSRRLDLLAVVDASHSIALVPGAESRVAQELQLAELSMDAGDRLGVVRFGAHAHLETPWHERGAVKAHQPSDIGPEATNLEQALDAALSELKPSGNRRVVLISDGVQTRGNVQNAIDTARSKGIPIDSLLLERSSVRNVHLTRFMAPASINRGEPFDLRVVVETPGPVRAELQLSVDGQLTQRHQVELPAGQEAYTLQAMAAEPGLRAYTLRVVSHDPSQDVQDSDNQLTEFIQVKGPSSILLVAADPAHPGPLASTLTDAGLTVTTVSPKQLPTEPRELGRFDLVAIGDVTASRFSSGHLSALERYVKDLGGGLLLLGSTSSFGPGGYAGTPIEAVSPVSFDVKQERQAAQLAQIVVIDASGSMAARIAGDTKLALAHEAVLRGVALLNDDDLLGILHVDKQAQWTVPLLRVGVLRGDIRGALDRLGPGGGGIAVDVGLRSALRALDTVPTHLRHVVLVADGSDVDGARAATRATRAAWKRGISTSVIALGDGRHLTELEGLSRAGHGRFHVLDSPGALPAVFAQETLAAAHAAVRAQPFRAQAATGSELLKGIHLETAPSLGGYVVTLLKERAQLSLATPAGDPLLATWSVGLGRVGAFTSDYGGEWGEAWATWKGGPQLLAQTVRSLLRAVDDAQIQMRARVRMGELQIRVDALNASGAMDTNRQLRAEIQGPDPQPLTFPVPATGGGRYALDVPLQRTGLFTVTLRDTLTGKLVARGGAEHRAGQELEPADSDRELMRRIASATAGDFRDTLAGIFRTSKLTTRVRTDVSGFCLGLGTSLLVVAVSLARLGGVGRRRMPGRPTESSNLTPHPPGAGVHKSTAQTLLEKRRSKAE
jgi:Ca-activated chloride channel homolog